MKKTQQTTDPRVKKALARFGLSDNEIVLYAEALKHEETSPYALSRATGIPRTTVYDVLMSLSLKGLVELTQSDGFSKQQTKIRAQNPSILRTVLQHKRKELTEAEVDIVEILPLLKGVFHKNVSDADFQFYPGIDGVKRVYFNTVPSSEPRIVWENLIPMDVFGIDETNRMTQRETDTNLEQTINHREIIPLTDWTRHVLSYQYGRDPNYIVGRKMRYSDNPLFDLHLSITVQGTRVYISCAHEDEVWGLVINSKAFSDALKAMFEVQWLVAQPVTKELVESWGKNQFLEAERAKKS